MEYNDSFATGAAPRTYPHLAEIIAIARQRGCPIVHISHLAGSPPFIASDPCLGIASPPLVEIDVDGYFALMAELRAALVVEHDVRRPFNVITGDGRRHLAPVERLHLPPHTLGGYIETGAGRVAFFGLLDSVGQETTILYDGLDGFAAIEAYWLGRAAVFRELDERFIASMNDKHELAFRLDRTVRLDGFPLDAFAAERGIAPRAVAR